MTLKKMTVSVLALLVGFCMTPNANADYHSMNANFEYIVVSAGLNPSNQEDRNLIQSALEKTAEESGESYEAIVERVAYESQNAKPDQEMLAGGNVQAYHVALRAPRYVGDVFYSSNSTFGIQHGHTGIYDSSFSYVEATSPHIRRVNAYWAEAPAPAFKYYVGWDRQSPNKYKAANFAAAQVGKGYNWFFWNNKTIYASTYNCSQLVWAAYKQTDPKVDLDSNGGAGVYPLDIKNSSWLHEYQRIG
ncbi:MAG: hypothetical protein Q4P78_00935 [Rothia sp. (in: high G+C Gram-positive bacteria)]|uniref:hypothetical protein n=1 Tax=Rothia sp. (in: high G+C Gram-positive bacteria) TaxID=1885016 RepID=UPI0026E0261B|nr:hypothetical protein [Rothia sp. (in: high G+C Gram-positive bacteria)]MDO5749755.1 hypothetical protein [Rothia sp. (in: high G+C Gram-positive bacteria)]